MARRGTMAGMPSLSRPTDPHAQARDFVRDRLGCGCPNELLNQIEIEFPPGPESMTRLKVGGRLLVHIRKCPALADMDLTLPRWLSEGVALRDALAFNRFRLVLLADAPDAMRPLAEARFAAQGADERTHLHLVATAEAGSFFARSG